MVKRYVGSYSQDRQSAQQYYTPNTFQSNASTPWNNILFLLIIEFGKNM